MDQVDAIPQLPQRPADAHKGTFGTVIVVGGCSTMLGAPALAASAALRGGVGLVKICTLVEVLPATITIEPSATGIIMASDPHETLAAIDAADPAKRAVLVIGPGMGRAEPTGELVRLLLSGRRTIVLDADGLNLLAGRGRPRQTPGPPLVLTPHPGEFGRLAKPLGISKDPTDPRSRPQAAAELAAAHSATVVLKGSGTVVCDGRRFYVNQTGNPALSTAGSGDVLSGLIAALLAQNMQPFDAAVLGTYLHGLAADLYQHGRSGMTASDLAADLPKAFQRLRCQATDTSATI